MSRDCCVAFPCGAMVCLQFVIVVFPDHTHLLFFMETLGKESLSYSKVKTLAAEFKRRRESVEEDGLSGR